MTMAGVTDIIGSIKIYERFVHPPAGQINLVPFSISEGFGVKSVCFSNPTSGPRHSTPAAASLSKRDDSDISEDNLETDPIHCESRALANEITC